MQYVGMDEDEDTVDSESERLCSAGEAWHLHRDSSSGPWPGGFYCSLLRFMRAVTASVPATTANLTQQPLVLRDPGVLYEGVYSVNPVAHT